MATGQRRRSRFILLDETWRHIHADYITKGFRHCWCSCSIHHNKPNNWQWWLQWWRWHTVWRPVMVRTLCYRWQMDQCTERRCRYSCLQQRHRWLDTAQCLPCRENRGYCWAGARAPCSWNHRLHSNRGCWEARDYHNHIQRWDWGYIRHDGYEPDLPWFTQQRLFIRCWGQCSHNHSIQRYHYSGWVWTRYPWGSHHTQG